MAYITSQDEDQQKAQSMVGGQPSEGAFVSGASNAPAPAAGTGGSHHFANIQTYLGANPSQAGDILNQDVGGEFGKESTAFGQSTSDYDKSLQGGQDYLKKEQDLGGQIGQLKNQYFGSDPLRNSWNANAFDQSLVPLRQGFSDTYSAPQYQGYNIGQTAQQYGQGIQNDVGTKGFKDFLGGVYNKRTGGQQMTPGEQNLQNQIDINNPNLPNIQQALKGQYNTLAQNVADTNTAEAAKGTGLEQQAQAARNANEAAYNKFAQQRQTYENSVNQPFYNVEGQDIRPYGAGFTGQAYSAKGLYNKMEDALSNPSLKYYPQAWQDSYNKLIQGLANSAFGG